MAALSHVTVLDLTQQLPGPYATLLLAGLGARVLKVEPPVGDMARTLDPPMFERVNAGKESIVLDLKRPGDQALLHRLAAGADVLVEGFRPGTAARLAADYETLSRVRPDLVYCSISGFGADGPYRDVPGHDLNYLGVAGGIAAGEASEPEEIGMPVIDMAAGTNAALAIVAALTERDRTGRGARLDVAMLDVAVFWAGVKVPIEATGIGEPTYVVLTAGDGRRLSLGVLEDKFWLALCRALEWDDWAADGELATHRGRRFRAAEVHARLVSAFARRPRDAWLEHLWRHDVPVAPVHEGGEVVGDPQVRHRGSIADGRPVVPLPSALRARSGTLAPAHGQHTAAVLAAIKTSGSDSGRPSDPGIRSEAS